MPLQSFTNYTCSGMLIVLIRFASVLRVHATYIFMMKYEHLPKLTLNICFLRLSEDFPGDSKKEFESATVNEPSVFELKLYCIQSFCAQLFKASLAYRVRWWSKC